jgi:hypothetical protein
VKELLTPDDGIPKGAAAGEASQATAGPASDSQPLTASPGQAEPVNSNAGLANISIVTAEAGQQPVTGLSGGAPQQAKE